jgi:threonine dehydratase
MQTAAAVSFDDVRAARERLGTLVVQTPMVRSEALSELSGADVFLKLEHHQRTGSFKLRGATNAVLQLSESQLASGVVGVSSGNHGRGLAYAAREAGVRCIICMSDLVPQNKVEGIKAQGAEVRIVGHSQDDAQEEVDRLVSDEGMTMLPPFDHVDIIAGQGTLGIEILEQCADAATIVVQLSGGGLISGLALAAKSQRPDLRIIGVSMERGAAMYECQKAGKPIYVEELATLADSLGGGIGLDNQYTFPMVRDLVDEMVLVSEAQIAGAIRHAYWEERQIIEGSGSVAIAAMKSGLVTGDGPIVLLVSGGNIDMSLHHRIIGGEDVDVTAQQ